MTTIPLMPSERRRRVAREPEPEPVALNGAAFLAFDEFMQRWNQIGGEVPPHQVRCKGCGEPLGVWRNSIGFASGECEQYRSTMEWGNHPIRAKAGFKVLHRTCRVCGERRRIWGIKA